MTVSQTEFRTALLDPQRAVPAGLQDASSGPAGARFSVYRNNVVHSLTEALATAFPLVRKLIGKTAFDQVAGLYVRSHPPVSPLMMFYGDSFPDFVAGCEPLAHLGYLADCARLDLALRQSYHAADATPLAPEALQTGPDTLMAMHLHPAPSTRVLRSSWPLFDLWRFNNVENAPKPAPGAQDVLITRPDFDPLPHLLPPGGAEWFRALSDNASLSQAQTIATENTPSFDLAATLSLALSTQAFAAL
ncbi:DNA-binding domain-containing protein [uncultured Roseobacter sp.]|uniref:HvfC/BufC N-terminal domain-containing protein n=1 Tax=uncultured Roseobacter sp. TaxID=114847 RepID=UPI002619E070|nr:DNA-binding domain-containing protein [uncultured Roseobacter sp.]